MELELSEVQVDELFDLLDYNKDGLVNYQDWCHSIRDDNQHLFYIKDSIYKN